MSESPKTILSLESILRRFSENQPAVLDDANFRLAEGEMVALVAPSGAGKSTLLHLAGLLEQPDSGDVIINGVSCGQMNDKERTAARRRDIGFVYQFHHLLAEFTAIENLILPQLINGLDKITARSRAMEMLSFLKVDHRAEHHPSQMSGGEQQRVAIARALINAPGLLLADEPTGNLDPTTSDTVFNTMLAIVRASGVGALIATHNIALAERMDRMVTLVDGKIVDVT